MLILLSVLFLLSFPAASARPLSTVEAAHYLGVSARQIRRLVASRELAHYRAGPRLLRFRKVDLDEWLSRGRVEAGAVANRGEAS